MFSSDDFKQFVTLRDRLHARAAEVAVMAARYREVRIYGKVIAVEIISDTIEYVTEDEYDDRESIQFPVWYLFDLHGAEIAERDAKARREQQMIEDEKARRRAMEAAAMETMTKLTKIFAQAEDAERRLYDHLHAKYKDTP